MSESAARSDDFDPVADAPRASDYSDEAWPDDDDLREQAVPANPVKPIPEIRQSLPRPSPPPPTTTLPEPSAARPSTANQPDVRLGLWGAPRSGKTTYLSALRIAAQKPVMGYEWTISGRDDASADFLDEGVDRFVADLNFPVPSRGYSTLSWKFEGTRHREQRGRLAAMSKKFLGSRSEEIDREFVVEMQDAAGEIFGKEADERYFQGVQSHLMNAHGIIYLFDPLLHKEAKTKTYDFFARTLSRLQRGMREQGRLAGSRLPHFVSVCVTKFDHPEIFGAAMDHGLINQEHESAMPTVPTSVEPEFLRSLCDDTASRWVCDQFQSAFVPERVRYFATSAIGFHLGHDNRFDISNFSNIAPDGHHFLSAATPINVLEPIISLQEQVRRQLGAE